MPDFTESLHQVVRNLELSYSVVVFLIIFEAATYRAKNNYVRSVNIFRCVHSEIELYTLHI